MKNFRNIFLLIILLTVGFVFTQYVYGKEFEENKEIEYKYEDVKDEVIRFHVLANSDSKEDQELKLKIRDEVIKYLEPLLSESKSIEESRKILMENDKEIEEISNKIIIEEGFDYKVKTELRKENFPEKIYGNIILPQGEYEAYRILIEKAQGQNWWCVMFPPLCFVDVTKGDIAYEETKNRMNQALENGENMKKVVFDDRKEGVNVKFKFVEIIEGIFSK